MFDADGDGTPEKVYYNGFKVVDPTTGKPLTAKSAPAR